MRDEYLVSRLCVEQQCLQGTYAGIYGQTISFFIQMFLLTGDAEYLRTAQQVADKPSPGWSGADFRGHPAKPYYEAMDGVGHLLYRCCNSTVFCLIPNEPGAQIHSATWRKCRHHAGR